MINNYRNIYLLGIGGIGMSALAKYFLKHGATVYGYDRTRSSLTEELEKLGAIIHYSPNISLIPNNLDLVIYTPAISKDFDEYKHLLQSGFLMLKRADVLSKIALPYYTIAVAGTHGKTTISALISFILKIAGKRILAFVGGILKNYLTNVIIDHEPEYCVVEADEYDRSFLKLNPDLIVISAIDPDHLDIYGTYDQIKIAYNDFLDRRRGNTKAFVQHSYINLCQKPNLIPYGIKSRNGYNAQNIRINGVSTIFDFYYQDKCLISSVKINYPGEHNLENAIAAMSVSHVLGIDSYIIVNALEAFQGLVRRFDIRYQDERHIYIDDYAHHPSEIEALIKAVRLTYPGRKLTGIFQPHLYSRTKDLANDFAVSLAKLDEVVITDIYPAREEPLPGVTSQWLLGLIKHNNKKYVSYKDIINFVAQEKPELLLTIGAGDIDKHAKDIENIFKRSDK